MQSFLRNVIFTLNNYTQDEYDFIVNSTLFKYLIVGKEIGESGTPHLQGYAILLKRMRFNSFKQQFPRFHIEPRKGNHDQAAAYCKKDGDFIEIGEPPKQGKRTDLSDAIETLKESGIQSVADEHPQTFVKYSRGLRDLALLIETSYDHKSCRGIWLYGPPGTGKSHTARSWDPESTYLKAQNKWFDGYNGQKIILLDDLDTPVLNHHLKIWSDKYACTGETKGGTIHLRHHLFVITSNYPIEHFTDSDEAMTEALKRRFTVIEKTNRETIIDYASLIN